MTDLEAAYIAGLFDGEGSVSFAWRKASKNGKRYGKLYARISQNDKAVLDWVKSTLSVGSVQPHPRADKKTLGHDFVVAHEAARIFLAVIRPYLRLKGGEVDQKLALDAIHCRRRKNS